MENIIYTGYPYNLKYYISRNNIWYLLLYFSINPMPPYKAIHLFKLEIGFVS